jgi:hypothetical protein
MFSGGTVTRSLPHLPSRSRIVNQVLEVITLLLVAVCFSFSLAHAGEFAGKMRSNEDAYRTVQTIYFPASLSVA